MTENVGLSLIRDEMSDRIVAAAEEIALSDGIDALNVRRILKHLGITNRVFYNRFKNIEDVLEVVYKRSVFRVRGCIIEKLDPEKDFFEQVNELVSEIIIVSYDTRMKMSGFFFESDLNGEENRIWWMAEIKKLLEYAMEKGFIKAVDPDKLSYSVWCFIRGYNADVVARKIPKNEAVEGFKYSFSFLLEGLKVN